MSVLLADIGGTHARFCLLKAGRLTDVYRFRCSDCKSPYAAIRSFLLMQDVMPDSAIIALAGVVSEGKGKWTNLPWSLSEKELKKQFGFRKVYLVNDLIPQGAGIPYLNKNDVVALNRAKPQKTGLKVLMSLGTGLGACILTEKDIYPTEYGQTILADGRILEKVLSGWGLKSVYATHTGKMMSARVIEKHMKQGEKHALNAYEHFYRELARSMQNLALLTQPVGGLYLAGGMLLAPELKKAKIFLQMSNHPTMNPLLKKIPVFLVNNKDLAFVGLSKLARKYGLT